MKILPCLFRKSIRTLSLFLLFFPLLVSCNKEKLTKPTQTGANTFSCKINGKVYVAKDNLFAPGLIGGLTGFSAGSYSFESEAAMYDGSKGGKSNYTIDIFCGPPISEGVIKINSGNVQSNISPIVYLINSGTINFTHIDYLSRITSGTFSFNAVNFENSADVISVTEGRFDMKN